MFLRRPVLPKVQAVPGEAAVTAGAHLLVFSGGVYEVELNRWKMWALEDLAAFREQPPSARASRMNGLLGEARRLQGSSALQDDVSILEAVFP